MGVEVGKLHVDRVLVAATRHALKRAVMALKALPDPDARYLRPRSAWPEVVRSAQEAYGYGQALPPRFSPSPHDVSTMDMACGWIAWVRTHRGEDHCRVILGWALGVPWHRLAGQVRIGERQAQRWLDDAVLGIALTFEPEVRRVAYQFEIQAAAAESAPVTYDHHWRSPDARPRHRPEMHRQGVAIQQLRRAATKRTA